MIFHVGVLSGEKVLCFGRSLHLETGGDEIFHERMSVRGIFLVSGRNTSAL